MFDLEDRGGALTETSRSQIAEIIAAELVKSGRFEIVPRTELRKRMSEEKRESYRECYEESCQIELGKELAANHVLQTQVVRIGRNCTLTMRLYDVRKATASSADSQRVRCEEEAVLDGSIRAAQTISGAREASKEPEFRASVLSELATPEAPKALEASEVTVSYSDVDVEALELFDAAVKSDRDPKVATKEKIARWQAVLDRAPRYRETAEARLSEWRRYQLQTAAIDEAKARLKTDWEKLSRLLALSVVTDEDKRNWASAFVESYGWDPAKNPYIGERALLGWVSGGSTDWAASAPDAELTKRFRQVSAELETRSNDGALLRQHRAISAELDCRRGKFCAFLGKCSYDPQVGGCFAASSEQCSRARVCHAEGRCRAERGECVRGGQPAAVEAKPKSRRSPPPPRVKPQGGGSGRAPLRNRAVLEEGG